MAAGYRQELKKIAVASRPKAACTPAWQVIDGHQEPPINWMQCPGSQQHRSIRRGWLSATEHIA